MVQGQGRTTGTIGDGDRAGGTAAQRYQAIFEQSMDPILVISNDGKLIDFNAAAYETLGYTREEFSELDLSAIEANETPAEVRAHMEQIAAEGHGSFASRHRTRDGDIRDVLVVSRRLSGDGTYLLVSTVRDVTDQKKMVAAVERKSVALQELLDQMQHQNRKFGQRVMANVETIIMPMVRDLQQSLPTSVQPRVQALAEALEELTAPFAAALSGGVARLTPVEIRICRLLRSGMSSKEIAAVQHLAPATVSKHRENIRRKLGITGTDINLVTHLNTLLLDADGQ